jgi:sugar lactone lactonase YvrE
MQRSQFYNRSQSTSFYTLRFASSFILLATLLITVTAAQDPPPASPPTSVYPLDTVASADGTLYIVDRNLPGVWRKTNDSLTVFVQGSKRFREPLNAPRCLALSPDGVLIVGDSATRDLYRIISDGKPEAITSGKIGIPMDIAIASNGTIYVADLETRTVVRIASGSNSPELFAKLNARGICLDASENLWVVTQDNEQLVKVTPDGKSDVIVASRLFDFPHQVAVNAQGDAFITDGYGKAIWKVVAGQAPQKVFQGEPLINPVGISLIGNEWMVTDPRGAKVFKFDNNNQPTVLVEVKR